MLTFVGEHDRLAIGVAHWRIAQRYCRIPVKCIGTFAGGVDSDVELSIAGLSWDPNFNTVPGIYCVQGIQYGSSL